LRAILLDEIVIFDQQSGLGNSCSLLISIYPQELKTQELKTTIYEKARTRPAPQGNDKIVAVEVEVEVEDGCCASSFFPWGDVA